MSHFAVLVIGDDLEGQMRPYQENNMGDCPEEFLQFEDQEDKFRKEYEEGGTERVVMPDGRLLLPWDEEFRIPGKQGLGSSTHKVPEGLKTREVPHKETYATFEEFVLGWHGRKARDPRKGRYGYWENANAKWDWYTVGGRWAGFWVPRHGTVVVPTVVQQNPFEAVVVEFLKSQNFKNVRGPEEERVETQYSAQLRLKDIDLEAMAKREAVRAANRWMMYSPAFEGREIPGWEEHRAKYTEKDIDEARRTFHEIPVIHDLQEISRANHDFFMGDYRKIFCAGDFKSYLVENIRKAFVTYAVVKEGQWYAPGVMGFWAMSTDTPEEKEKWNAEFVDRFILPNDPETWMTVVDCHI